MKKPLVGILFLSLFIFPVMVTTQEEGFDVPFVPTPQNVVAEMLKMGNVNKNDVIYDLGCGDGRIVITAAKKMGARGVGIDINPQRISESRENAKKENVSDRVEFRQQNLFEADISPASIVTLYLLTEVNIRLRPKLLRELKPGTRIVSHNYAMGEWEPEQSTVVEGQWSDHDVYYWIVPANVSGTWEWLYMQPGSGSEKYLMKLNQKFQTPNGTLTVGSAEIPLQNIVLKGDRLQFTIEKKTNSRNVLIKFDGRVNGDFIEGNVISGTGKEMFKSDWKATRNPSTITSIDGAD